MTDRRIGEVAFRLIRGMPHTQQGRARTIYHQGCVDTAEMLELALARNAAEGEPVAPMVVVDQFIKEARQ
jgi:hypothetical protein